VVVKKKEGGNKGVPGGGVGVPRGGKQNGGKKSVGKKQRGWGLGVGGWGSKKPERGKKIGGLVGAQKKIQGAKKTKKIRGKEKTNMFQEQGGFKNNQQSEKQNHGGGVKTPKKPTWPDKTGDPNMGAEKSTAKKKKTPTTGNTLGRGGLLSKTSLLQPKQPKPTPGTLKKTQKKKGTTGDKTKQKTHKKRGGVGGWGGGGGGLVQ